MTRTHNIDKENFHPHKALWAGVASLITVTLLIAAKTVTYFYTGSTSILASLMDSLLDATVSLTMFMAIRYSLKPADRDHRHGHGKIEGLAALFQAVLIGAAALLLLIEAGNRFISPEPVTGHLGAIIVMILTITMSVILVLIQNYTLKSAPSVAVEADKTHYSNDIVINGGVIVVMAGLYFGAPAWIDPLFAIFVAAYLAYTVYHIGKRAIDMLLDRELPDDVRREIKDCVNSHPAILGLHDLRTSQSGMRIFISFDIEVDADLSLRAAHEIARAVENKLLTRFAHAEIMIHVDPHGDAEDSRHSVAGVHL